MNLVDSITGGRRCPYCGDAVGGRCVECMNAPDPTVCHYCRHVDVRMGD